MRTKRLIACLLTFLLITGLLPQLFGGKIYAASDYFINTVSGTGVSGYSGDGAEATSAQLKSPYGVAVDNDGNLYIADSGNNRIRKVDTSGEISTVAGTGASGFSGDGGLATEAQLKEPSGVAVDSSGNLYITDTDNHRIRKVDTSGNISTFAGTGVGGYSGDGAEATLAQLKSPYGLAVDSNGLLYIADFGNNRIRKIDASGNMVTVAGGGSAVNPVDGVSATEVQLSGPSGVAADGNGNLYIVEYYGNRIRKVDTSGKISTVAGTGTEGYAGDGASATSAQLKKPTGVAVDSSGNLYIADNHNNRIRKVDTSGKISTFAGTVDFGFSGDGGSATSARLNGPDGVAVDSDGNLYLSDSKNGRIRKVFELAHTVSASAVSSTPAVGEEDAVTLTVKDVAGNTATLFSGTYDVTISGYEQAPDNTYGSFNGTALTASPNTISVTFASGVATANLSLNKAADQTIGFSVAGVATPATNALSITPAAGSAVSMALTTDITAPASNGGTFAQQPIAVLRDVYGNTSAGDSSTVVTASKKDSGAWTLTGTVTATASSGAVTFTDLGATNAAEMTGAQLAFDAGGLAQITSTNVTLPWPSTAKPRVESVAGGDGHVFLEWSEVYGAVSYDVYQSTASGTYGAALATVSEPEYDVTGLTNGTTYYFVVKATNPGGDSAASDEVSATPITVPSEPTEVTATAGDGQATVSFTGPTDNGGSAITGYEVTASPGNITVTGAASPITVRGLSNGSAYTFTVKAVNHAGNSTASVTSNTVTPRLPSGNSDTPTQPNVSSTPDTPNTVDTGVQILVNGIAENAGTATTTIVNKQTITKIVIDPKKLEDKLAAEGQRAVITIAANTKSDAVVGELNGHMIKNLEQKQAVVEIKTENGTYTLPAQQINISAISDQLGKSVQLTDIKIQVEISMLTADTLEIVENSAAEGEFTLVAPPLNFTVKAIYGDTTIEVSKFNAYVERTFAIPDGVDPSKITTGIVIEPDGTVRHVPTKIVVIDGKSFAKVYSLTNSTYSIVWHPLEFKDVAQHWAKEAVNDMASRMIINGIGDERFSPDRDITRAEFTAIMVRALGLKLGSGAIPFTDVKTSDWYSSAINTAYGYHLISGYEDGSFRPMDKITREQAMTMIAKAMTITHLKAKLPNQPIDTTLRPYTDTESVSSWALGSIADSIQAGIVSGRNGATIAPKAFITRAEVATIVQRLLQKSDLIS